MNEHAKFLMEESEAAMADDCPVASNGYRMAANEIELLSAKLEHVTIDRDMLAACVSALVQSLSSDGDIRKCSHNINVGQFCGICPTGIAVEKGQQE